MKKYSLFVIYTVFILALAPMAHAEHKELTADYSFASKTECQNGKKMAGFKNATHNVTWFSANQISDRIKDLSWPDSKNAMSFDAREGQKTQLMHVQKVLHDFSCDTQDNPAQSGNGLLQGATNPTQNGTSMNSNVMPQ